MVLLKNSLRKLCLFMPLIVLGLSCGRNGAGSGTDLSDVKIEALEGQEYDRFELELISRDPSFKFPPKSFNRGAVAEVQIKVPAGPYTIRLDYFLKDQKIFSADYCTGDKKNNQQTFAPGPVTAIINVCRKDDGGSVTPGGGATGASFSVKDGSLYDKTGKLFVMRGLSMPFAYYFDKSMTALDDTKKFGFNTVRIVWCADNLLDYPDRCAQKDVHPASDLEKILARMKQLKLVAVFNLQNATGSDKRSDLQTLTAYLLKPEIKKILNDYKDMVIINLANEWYGSWNKPKEWFDSYKAMLPQLRSGGLNHTIVIDTTGYGQEFASIPAYGPSLLEVDKNILLAAHMYDQFGTIEKVKTSFASARAKKLPLIIGEFACSHGDRGTVACDAIMNEAENTGYKVGTIAWSYTGNGTDLRDLNIVDQNDWKTLTTFGKKVIESGFGVKATSKEACFFAAAGCP